jgi:ribose transport system permease protein
VSSSTEHRLPTSSPSAEQPTNRLRSILLDQQFILLVALVVLVAFFTSRNTVFLSSGEVANILADFCSVILLAVGEMYVIVAGGIDLSVGSAAGFSGIVGAFAMRAMLGGHQPEPFVLLVGTAICALVGLGIGLVNAALMNWAKLVPFVATLVTLGAAGGMSIVLTGGAPIGQDTAAILFTQATLGPFSYPSLGVIGIVVVAGLYLHYSQYGRYTFAIGSNAFAARAAGINVQRHLTTVYALSGLLAGLTGMFFYLRLGSGAPTSGSGAELNAIAACVIGGVSLYGGVGKLFGTVLGALIITTVTSGLIISNVEANWNQVAVAVLIAAAAALQALRTPGAQQA